MYDSEERKKLIIIIIITLLLIITGIYYFSKYEKNTVYAGGKEKQEEIEEEIITKDEVKTTPITNAIKVDIKGAIKKPGVYEANDTSRVIDIISQAGGLNKNANTSPNNLSQKVFDEMVIIIYTNDEIKDFLKKKEEEQTIQDMCKNNNYETKNDTCINTENKEEIQKETTNKISINTATKEELMTISNIGESKAIAIIKYREENGLFKQIEDIKNVSGIGDAIYEKIKDYIRT